MFRQTAKTPEGSTANSRTPYEVYSRALGYQLKGTEDIALIREVDSWLGVPYRYGGCSKKGTDCSCMIGNIYRKVYNIDLPRRSSDIADVAVSIDRKQLQEGDLIFFRISDKKVSHVGLHISKGYFIHASTSAGVIINHISEPYYNENFAFAGRIKRKDRK
ncbi:MAG: C40 family peptidase [Bacteroidales bacterium]|nr:C40 family peptidase [Bacteroidales bacterium]